MKITTSSVRSYGPLWFAGLFAVGMLVVAAIGGYRAYLPLPYMDMWDGYLRFFLQARDGDLGVWWSQHNEHRIVLARLLFWADLTWLQGASYFLIVVNYVVIGCNPPRWGKCLNEKLPTCARAWRQGYRPD